jgi:peptide methionine sulfoxide reductase MsrA
MAEVTKEQLYPSPLVTELEPLTKLWPAEDYHQNYYNLNPNQVRPTTVPVVGVAAVYVVGVAAMPLLPPQH